MNKHGTLKVIFLLLPALLLFTAQYIGHTSAQYRVPGINGGVLDLGGWSALGYPSFHMSGEWELYADQLADGAAINSGTGNFTLFSLPYSLFKKVDAYGQPLPEYNTATYRIRVINAPTDSGYTIRLGPLCAAYRLYVDDRLLAANGKLSDDLTAPISAYRSQRVHFSTDKNSFDMILQTANQYDTRGLLQWPLVLEYYDAPGHTDDWESVINYLMVGGLLTISLLLLVFWLLVPGRTDLLILGLFGFTTMMRVMIIQEVLIADLLPQMSLIRFSQMDYTSGFLIQLLAPASIAAIYSRLLPRWFSPALLIYTLGLFLCVAAAPGVMQGDAGLVFDMFMALIVLVVIIALIRAVLENRPGSAVLLILLSSVVVLFLFDVMADSSLAYQVLSGSGLVFGVIILVECVIIARNFKEAQQLELHALKEQIRPHFIHNALSAIISISRTDPDRSRQLLVNFSSYLRGHFDYTNIELITIEQELEMVKAYVALQQARFGDGFRVNYLIETDNFLIPPLTLQPLVENALTHGLRLQDSGTVVVYTQRSGDMVRIGVRDDGCGMDSQDSNLIRRGIGIANINRRLNNLYGSQLQFLSPPGGGCEVYLEIPYKEVDGHQSATG